MFGYIQASVDALSEEEKKRYGAAYCGLCRTLKARYGWPTRFSLSYEMTYLVLFLSSLYEPEETGDDFRCIVHPWTKSQYAASKITEYAADMTVLLVYHKCMDDWNDEHKHLQHRYSKWLEKPYRQAKQLWPEQAEAIERGLTKLSEIETASESAPDAAANCFGEMLSHLFLYKKDHWQETLMEFGYGLGQFIYMMDAVMDCEKKRQLPSGDCPWAHSRRDAGAAYVADRTSFPGF